VTPLRDGLNLVCKEYCAVHGDGSGVLILSEFAGAAFEMGEALLVNPNSRTDMVDALYAALTMDEEEMHERMRVLHARVTEANNETWAAGFLAAVKDVSDRNAAFESCLLDRTSSPATFTLAKEAIAVLDVDAASALQFRSRKATQQMLMRLIENLPASTLVTITSASAQDVSSLWFPPNAWIIAERGAAIRAPGGEWRAQPTPEPLDVYRPEILRTLKQRASLVPRSRVVENSASIYWILGHSAAAFVTPLVLETVHALNILLARTSWCCIRTGFGLAVVNTQHTVASALDYIASITETTTVGSTASPSVVSIGDRWSDVTLFQWRAAENQSIAVGSPVSAAKYVVPTLSELLRVLQADASLSPAVLSSPLLTEGNNRQRRSGVGVLTGAVTPPWRPHTQAVANKI
jgi:trehalose 6-phosphate synthase/phosphatase